MFHSKIQNTLRAEATAATMLERRARHTAWLQREARRRNGGTIAYSVKNDTRAEIRGDVRSAEKNGEWVTMTYNGKVAGIHGHKKRSNKKQEKVKDFAKNACKSSKFALLDIGSDDENDQDIIDVIEPISNNIQKEKIRNNTWATVAMNRLPSNHVAQKWDKVEKLAEVPSSTKVSDYITQAITNEKKPIMDAWEDSDDETEEIPTTNNKKSWFEMMEDSDEEEY